MKKTARIDDWEVQSILGDDYLIGRISNHERQPEFKTNRQITSRLKKIDRIERMAETENTIYFLGEENGKDTN